MKREKIAVLPQLFDAQGDIHKSWFVYFSVRNPKTGKMVRVKKYESLNTTKSIQERKEIAQKMINTYTDLLKNGFNPFEDDNKCIYTDQFQYYHAARMYKERKLNNKTFNFLSGEYLRTQLTGLDVNTISTYKSKLRTINLWLQRENYADVDISAITQKVILDFFQYLNEERKISKITYLKYKRLLVNCFEYFIDMGSIKINPVQRIPKCTRVTSMEPHPIHDLDVGKFMEKIRQSPQLYMFVLFEYYCFMRPTEVRLMKISWIDFGRGMINIPREISKTRKLKTPLIPDELLIILREEFKLHQEPKDYYIIGKYGKPGTEHLGKNTMRLRFNKIRKELNMPMDYMLYSWKHTGNVRLEEANIPTFDRMMQNGHTSIRTTEIYTRNKVGFRSEAIRKTFPKLV